MERESLLYSSLLIFVKCHVVCDSRHGHMNTYTYAPQQQQEIKIDMDAV
jgi:hypothetical protein